MDSDENEHVVQAVQEIDAMRDALNEKIFELLNDHKGLTVEMDIHMIETLKTSRPVVKIKIRRVLL